MTNFLHITNCKLHDSGGKKWHFIAEEILVCKIYDEWQYSIFQSAFRPLPESIETFRTLRILYEKSNTDKHIHSEQQTKQRYEVALWPKKMKRAPPQAWVRILKKKRGNNWQYNCLRTGTNMTDLKAEFHLSSEQVINNLTTILSYSTVQLHFLNTNVTQVVKKLTKTVNFSSSGSRRLCLV